MGTAKKLRMSRIIDPKSGRAIIIPIDHGLTLGPIAGLESTRAIAEWIKHPAINSIIAHKGIIERLAERQALQSKGVIVHLNGMTVLDQKPDDKTMLTTVAAAGRLGADGVSLQVNFNGENDRQNWQMLGSVADEARDCGLFVLTMLYDKAPTTSVKQGTSRMKHLLRAAVELGTDAIKIGLPEGRFELDEVMESICEDAMMFVAGGSLLQPRDILSQFSHAMRLGAAGVCVGRNVFARQNPDQILNMLKATIIDRAPSLEVMESAANGIH